MIVVADLSVTFPGGFKALNNVTVRIPSNKVTCILGPNGAGKTTLLRTIAKMLSFKGSILIDGFEVARTPLKTIARLVSYASQLYVHELLSLTVEEALLTARYPVSRGFLESREDYAVVERVSRELKINHLLKRKLSQLSSGELQRVVLALALVKEPRILLFDELDAHVDIGVKSILAKLVHKWASGRAVVFTTHDVLFGSSIGEYFIVIAGGRVLYAGDLDGLIERLDDLKEVYGAEISAVEVSERKLLIPRYV